MTVASLTRGIDHVGLTVRDLTQTKDFFVECLGWKQVGEKPDYPAVFVSDGHLLVTLWQRKNEDNPVDFDRRSNVGLHHLALRVESEDALNEITDRISRWPGAKVEFAPELLGKGPKKHAMIFEPGGIRLEFDFAPGA
ncbi:VOC family protein [Caballeronia sp. BR00000012568055]|uniref:VOC family protein n=1 Tax=Caballeronia sp. BR00000012568055 TaxID=2918761 RepID=UPI0023FA287D|nr:VOC family protein [Caballeronia sp. BR00000012568055]